MYGGLSMIDFPSDASNCSSEPEPQEEAVHAGAPEESEVVVHCAIVLLLTWGVSGATMVLYSSHDQLHRVIDASNKRGDSDENS
jgi:hypothetical protein